MFRLFQPRYSIRKLLPAGVDAHGHLLPGVDDGAGNTNEALDIIRGQQNLGLRGAICTPHIMTRYPQNTPEHLRQSFAAFQSTVNRELANFRLHLAAEYMLDEGFPRHLASGDLLTIDSTWLTQPQAANSAVQHSESKARNQDTSVNSDRKYLLVELPQYLLPPGWQDMLDSVLAQGITPLLAHPERYLRILDEKDIRGLARRGIALQGNLGSLTGFYGRRVRSIAQSLLADKLYTTWGTDVHTADMLNTLRLTA